MTRCARSLTPPAPERRSPHTMTGGCVSERRSDPPRGPVRWAVGGARGELHDSRPRARRRRPGPLPRHAGRHLDRRRVVAGNRCDRGARTRAAHAAGAPRPARRPVGTVDDARRRRRRSRAHGRAAAAARSDGRGRHRAGDARARQRRLRRSRRARLGLGDGQGDGQAGDRRRRPPAGALPRLPRARAAARPSRPSSRTSSVCRAS